MKTRAFDCVAMMHRGQAEIFKKLAGMTPREKLAYWRQRTEELREKQQKAKARLASNRGK